MQDALRAIVKLREENAALRAENERLREGVRGGAPEDPHGKEKRDLPRDSLSRWMAEMYLLVLVTKTHFAREACRGSLRTPWRSRVRMSGRVLGR